MNHKNCRAKNECANWQDNLKRDWCRGCTEYLPSGAFNPNFAPATAQTTRNGHPKFYEILEQLADLHSRKNADYANKDPLSNLRMCELGGIPGWKGVIVRLTDKISRLLTFADKESYQVKDESVEDTFRDAAIYSILGLILYQERSANKSKAD
jgi:hypothetical protein